MNHAEIILETVEYYHTDPTRRASENGECLYQDSRGNQCAVGRCLKSHVAQQLEGVEGEPADTILYDLAYDFPINEFMKDEYVEVTQEDRSNDYGFWLQLQNLHDSDMNWTLEGITPHGKSRAQDLLGVYVKDPVARAGYILKLEEIVNAV